MPQKAHAIPNAPTFGVPDVVPELPELDLPSWSLPQLPGIPAPILPSIAVPEVPDIAIPQFKLWSFFCPLDE